MGDAEPGRGTDSGRSRQAPLDGYRILSVEQHGAAPFATLHLADLGAEVIKLEDPSVGGDVGRRVGDDASGDDSVFFQALNRGKRSVALDLATSAGQSAFHRLVANSDAVVANVRGDVANRLGLRHQALASVNPQITVCVLSGFGMSGENAGVPAYDPTIQALTGWMTQTGDLDDPPTKSGLSLVDFCSGYVVALAVVAGINAARRDRRGSEQDLSMFDVGISLLSYVAAWQLTLGEETPRRRRSAHPSIAPFQLFRARDGWLMIGAVKERQWRALATEVLSRPDLLEDERFASGAARRGHLVELEREVESELANGAVDEWATRCRLVKVPCAPCRDVLEALTDPLVAERGLILTLEHPRHGQVYVPATPFRTDRSAVCAPALGADTEAVLRDVGGVGDDEYASLAEAGAFGASSTCP